VKTSPKRMPCPSVPVVERRETAAVGAERQDGHRQVDLNCVALDQTACMIQLLRLEGTP